MKLEALIAIVTITTSFWSVTLEDGVTFPLASLKTKKRLSYQKVSKDFVTKMHIGERVILRYFCGCCFSVAKLCPTLCNPMDCSTLGSPVRHYLLELTHIYVH